jgi:hypothetical protein
MALLPTEGRPGTATARLISGTRGAIWPFAGPSASTVVSRASTIRRRLAALSSLYKHLVRHGHAARNPVGEVERPAINRDEGSTLAFSKAQARKVLDAPAEDTIAGLRDRAILSVGLQVGLRRAEIAGLKVGDLHQNRGYDSLRVARKGGRRDALAINPQTAARLRAYLEASGHGDDIDGPLFRPLRHNGKQDAERPRGTATTSTDPCSGRSGTTASKTPSAGIWTPTQSIASCESTPLRSGSTAVTPRTRCAPRSSPRRSKTARSSRMYRRPPGTAIRAQQNYMIDAGTTRRRPRASLRPTNGTDKWRSTK